MAPLALALVLVSAVCHATWNLLAKRASAEGTAFVWLMAACSTTLWAPVAAVFFIRGGGVSVTELVAYTVSAALHAVYFVVLQRGYGSGDLSVVYPVARGTGPLLASVGAIVLLGERPSPIGVAGIVSICAGVFVLGLPERSGAADAPGATGRPAARAWTRRLAVPRARRSGLAYGVLTGVLIGAYTLWDGNAVGHLEVSPVLLMWTTDLGRSALMLPLVARGRTRARETWGRFRWYALAGGVLSPASYILVLVALTLSPITSVAPLREVSVLLGVLFGARLLAEGHTARRLAAATAVALGAAAIAVG